MPDVLTFCYRLIGRIILEWIAFGKIFQRLHQIGDLIDPLQHPHICTAPVDEMKIVRAYSDFMQVGWNGHFIRK
jgi:hypothetical protein